MQQIGVFCGWMRILTGIALAFLTVSASAEEFAAGALRNAGSAFRGAAFHAEVSIHGQTVVIEKLPHEFSFVALIGDQDRPIQSFLIDQNGSFYQDSAEQIQFQSHVPSEWFSILSSTTQFSNNPRTQYQISDSQYGNIPCVLITAQIPDDNDSVDMIAKRFPGREFNKVRANYPFRGVFLVGRDYPFVFSYALFDRQGNRTAALDWGDIDFSRLSFKDRFQQNHNGVANDKDAEFSKRIKPFLWPENRVSAAEIGYAHGYTVKNMPPSQSSRGYDLIISSRDATRHTDFVAEIMILEQTIYGKKIFQKLDSKSGIAFMREETYFRDKLDQPEGIFFTTSSGSYLVTDKVIVQSNDTKPYMATLLSKAYRYLPPDASYTVSSGRYNGMDVDKVTVKIPPDSEYVAKLQAHWAESGQQNDMSDFPFRQIYLIDKERKFLYSYQAFGGNKELIFSRTMGNISFVTPQDDLFVLPDGEISHAADYQELKTIVQQAHGSNRGSSLVSQISAIPSAMVNVVERNFFNITHWGSRLALLIAILAIGWIVFIKMKSRKR